MQHGGRREVFNLGTTNKTVASINAKNIYLSLKAEGWESTLNKFKASVQHKGKICTIGEFLDVVKDRVSTSPETFENYAVSFRKIVGDIMGINGGNYKYDYRGGGRNKWLANVHAVRMDKITPGKVQKWKQTFIRKAGSDPVKQKAARISVNSFIRCSKSLFSPKKILPFIKDEILLPDTLPFNGIEKEKESNTKYRSEIDPELLLVAAQRELSHEFPEQYKIFLLCLLGGLRKEEVDKLLWSQINFNQRIIRIEATKFFHPKTESSEDDVHIDLELIDILRSFKSKATDQFVIESPNSARPEATYRHYRCHKEFNSLNTWLRSKGITVQKPLHSLRKEFGSLINEKYGLYAAKEALRHSDIGITARHYIDQKQRVSVGLGPLLKEPSLKVVSV